ncbi:aminotransferase class V-fold PLP-dependent enzyme [Emticicia agri]|uniref:Alanine--glyoxylate aminotransferase family protein n=1 Tax=Emticicia agri TaxID=2492393 RepID=A0A4Q5M1M3_9BACT|nr:aminotransferase class V-fold PLP-dependent enzyme [Emticicia agri]RYU95737.1 alanine--glyoxylate aminotransferase family protein [Emticicia agri]
MITFYPGPSKIYPQVAEYLQDAVKEGILSQNHRSQAFMDMLKECISLFKQKLNIPTDYQVYFTSSATECWEIVAQSFTAKGSLHIYNGAFGQKWFDYNRKMAGDSAFDISFDYEDTIPILETDTSKYDILCITQNETSNATQVDVNQIPMAEDALIAFDVTSSIGGIELNWTKGDIWLASVQKCLGLPAGLGVMVCSPRALQHARTVGERKHYNSFLFIHENFEKFQTPYTPNVLAIYLLKRVMEQVADIDVISAKLKARNLDFCRFIEEKTIWKLLIDNESVRSDTVIAIEGVSEAIKDIKQKAKEAGITLGNGYGNWKETTFRIANFPAIEDWEFEALKTCLV